MSGQSTFFSKLPGKIVQRAWAATWLVVLCGQGPLCEASNEYPTAAHSAVERLRPLLWEETSIFMAKTPLSLKIRFNFMLHSCIEK